MRAACSPADDDDWARRFGDRPREGRELLTVVEIVEREVTHDAEHAIVGQVTADECVDLLDRSRSGLLDIDDVVTGQARGQLRDESREVDTRVRVDRHDRTTVTGGSLGGGVEFAPRFDARPDDTARRQRDRRLFVVGRVRGGVGGCH